MITLRFWIPSITAFILVAFLGPQAFCQSSKGSSSKYIVMMITNHEGKTYHKALSDKEKEGLLKKIDDDYKKARKAWQDEKKEAAQKKSGEKFSKPEPQKPKTKVVKTDLKSFTDAKKLEADLDRSLEAQKNGNGKSTKTAKAAKNEDGTAKEQK